MKICVSFIWFCKFISESKIMDQEDSELLETDVCVYEQCTQESRLVTKVSHHKGHKEQIITLKDIQTEISQSTGLLRSKQDMIRGVQQAFKSIYVQVMEALEARKQRTILAIEEQFKPMMGFHILRERILEMKDRQSIEEIQNQLPFYTHSVPYIQLLEKIDKLIEQEILTTADMTIEQLIAKPEGTKEIEKQQEVSITENPPFQPTTFQPSPFPFPFYSPQLGYGLHQQSSSPQRRQGSQENDCNPQ